jgi:hypothetical protein
MQRAKKEQRKFYKIKDGKQKDRLLSEQTKAR